MTFRSLTTEQFIHYAGLLPELPAYVSAPKGVRVRMDAFIATVAPVAAEKKARIVNAAEGDPDGDLQTIDREADQAWSALYLVSLGFSRLPSGDPLGFAARTFQEVIFPNKLDFTRFTMQKQFVHCDMLLSLIADRGLAVPLKKVGFEHLVQNAERAHVRYGQALRGWKSGAKKSLSEDLRLVRRAFGELVHFVELSRGRELSEEDAKALLEPLARAEEQAKNRRRNTPSKVVVPLMLEVDSA